MEVRQLGLLEDAGRHTHAAVLILALNSLVLVLAHLLLHQLLEVIAVNFQVRRLPQ